MCFIARSDFVTLGKIKKHRITITLSNFFDEKNFQLEFNKCYQDNVAITCDLQINVKCNKEIFVNLIKQTEYGKVKNNSLILVFDVNFKQDSLEKEIRNPNFDILIKYTADHKYLNEVYGKKCMADYLQKGKRKSKSLKEITIMRGRPMQGGGCNPR